jgi:hypothetical protein
VAGVVSGSTGLCLVHVWAEGNGGPYLETLGRARGEELEGPPCATLLLCLGELFRNLHPARGVSLAGGWGWRGKVGGKAGQAFSPRAWTAQELRRQSLDFFGFIWNYLSSSPLPLYAPFSLRLSLSRSTVLTSFSAGQPAAAKALTDIDRRSPPPQLPHTTTNHSTSPSHRLLLTNAGTSPSC